MKFSELAGTLKEIKRIAHAVTVALDTYLSDLEADEKATSGGKEIAKIVAKEEDE